MKDCPCVEGSYCSSGLGCQLGVCRVPGGEGEVGNACFSNRTCLPGARCVDDECVECDLGEEGCGCLQNGTCNSGLSCQGTLCADPNVPEHSIPSDPKCYTPCREGFSDPVAGYRECPADGLMDGCIGGARCEHGSCVLDEQPASGCAVDIDCPDFQVCIDGGCYADCEYDSDCPVSARCYRHACRVPCGSDAATCSEGTYCAVTDGDRGFCMPLAEPLSSAAHQQVSGSFSLSSKRLALSNLQSSATIRLTHTAPHALEFTLRKLEHRTLGEEAEKVSGTNALPWLHIVSPGSASGGSHADEGELELIVDGEHAGQVTELEFSVDDTAPARWEGTIEVASAELGVQKLSLSYSAKPDGRWSGKQYYFGQFSDVGLESWRADPTNESKQQGLKNAFMRKWAGLRALMGGGAVKTDVALFQAVLQSTLTESWKWPSIQAICPVAACLPYDNAQGYAPYVDDIEDAPVPTGVVELPIALDLREIGSKLKGRIVSAEALHYAGDPAFELAFASAPSECTSTGKDCLVFKATGDSGVPNARIAIGGRYRTTATDASCLLAGNSLKAQRTPSLIPGFSQGVDQDPDTGLRYFHECRDASVPYADDEALNLSLAQANPVPDGSRRIRALKVVDGFLLNGETLYLVFKEYFEGASLGLIHNAELPAYGVMVLHRTNSELSPGDFKGSVPGPVADAGLDLDGLTECSPELVEKLLGAGSELSSANASSLVHGLLDGITPDVEPTPIATEQVHYLCHDTGLFDQGPWPTEAPVSCPAGSGVSYFVGSVPADLSVLECQTDASCGAVLDQWKQNPSTNLLLNPVWRCTSENAVYCDKNRFDLRDGKMFFEPLEDRVAFPPLSMEIENAFRYRTQFRNREGKGLGFAPAVCVAESNIVPYCYDPKGIEAVRERVDCLLSLFTSYDLDEETWKRAQKYLAFNFASFEETDPTLPQPIVHDGFEFLNAQLLITLGDESFTRAFQSRFDLAGVSRAAFEGSKFEAGGIDLSGVAGFEMYTLYQAVQYYQMVLDRFFTLAGFIRRDVDSAVNATPPRVPSFVRQETVTSYMDRALRASAQKSRAYSEIAKRYQHFQRPDLARRVVERAYTGAYLESMLMTRLMDEITNALEREKAAQVRDAIDRAQRVYRAAMLEMRELYADLTDQVNFYGFAADYIPFPELEPGGPNAFQTLISLTKQKLETARQHEENALSSSQAFNTSQEEFQRELASIRTTYENQLAELCGTFEGRDGNVYPAIAKYAYLDDRAQLFGDPCGLMGNGAIHEGIVRLEGVELDAQGVSDAYEDLYEKIEIEEVRIKEHCTEIKSIADYAYQVAGKEKNLSEDIAETQAAMRLLRRELDASAELFDLQKCIVGLSTDCASAATLSVAWTSMVKAAEIHNELLEKRIRDKQTEIADLQRTAARWQTTQQCDLARIDSDALVKGYLLDLKSIDLEALRTDYRIRLGLSEIEKLRNQAARLFAEQQDAEQLAINVQAARTDPNVRIYKNDAILNADRSFEAALKEAYKATRAFEYYTSQSYGRLETLALVRLVSRGDYSLERYVRELEDAYASFAESFGRPDLRVDILSLRDDILSIPRHASDGTPLSEAERVQRFREALTDRRMLDENAHLSIPFSTNLGRLSPVTRNHKLAYIEAEIIGSDIGDTLGRLYLRQGGTGVLHSVDGVKSYYRFPERLAVIDPFFNGVRVFVPEVYKNDRLRDRPYVNTHWELLLNQVDEQSNQDINLNAVSDIRLLVFYTDFTAL